MKKLCYVCSCGGHYEEALRIRGQLEQLPSFVITEKTPAGQVPESEELYALSALSRRDPLMIFKLAGDFFRSVSILRREKPTHVAAFGALVCLPVCLAAKCMGIPVLYVESIARVYDLSLTGKVIYPMADLFIVQWEELLERYPRAVFGGRVY